MFCYTDTTLENNIYFITLAVIAYVEVTKIEPREPKGIGLSKLSPIGRGWYLDGKPVGDHPRVDAIEVALQLGVTADIPYR